MLFKIWHKISDKLIRNVSKHQNIFLASNLLTLSYTVLILVERLKPTGQCVTSPLMPYTGDESQDLEADNYNKQVPCDK